MKDILYVLLTFISLYVICIIEIQKIQMNARDHLQKIFNDHEKVKLQLEAQMMELELRRRELEKREAKNESESSRQAEEIKKVWHFKLHRFSYFISLS